MELNDINKPMPVPSYTVIGTPDEKWGERPLALVVPRPGSGLTKKDITHHVKEYADKGMVNKQIVLLKVRFVEELDKTSVGKVSKVTLREKYSGGA